MNKLKHEHKPYKLKHEYKPVSEPEPESKR